MISIFQGKFFPFQFRVVACFIPIAVTIKIIADTVHDLSLLFYGILLLVSVMIIFTNWTLEISVDEKFIRKNLQFLIFRIGRKQPYQAIEKIFINQVKQSSTYIPNRIQSVTVTEDLFKAFIKLDNGDKLLLDSDADKDALIGRLADYNQLLQTNILDNSNVHNPYWITTL